MKGPARKELRCERDVADGEGEAAGVGKPVTEEVRPRVEILSMVLWVHDGPVCVSALPESARPPLPASCQCAACRTGHLPDLACEFLD